MSAAYALVRFKKTGNVYFGCYEGTSDTMIPHICTPEECYNDATDCYCAISYCRTLGNSGKSWIFPTNIADLDDVEIYSSYGGGFYWNTTGSESIKMLSLRYDEWGELDLDDEKDGIPEWAEKFLNSLEESDDGQPGQLVLRGEAMKMELSKRSGYELPDSPFRASHIRCGCGGIIGDRSIVRHTLKYCCDECGEEYMLYNLDYDVVLFNDKTGWSFPMKVKEIKSNED